jgi:Sec-independent protein translocase protein TatA
MSWGLLWKLIKGYCPLLLIVAAFLLVFGMASRIEVLKADLAGANKDNSELVKKLGSKDATITSLQNSAATDRLATNAQLEKERQMRGKADAENEALRKILDASDCSNKPLPGAAIDILR